MEGEEELRNKDPEIIRTAFSTVIGVLQLYGWVILIGVLVIYYLHSKLRPRLAHLRQQQEDSSYKKMDAGAAQSRLEAMEKARMKQQALLDEQARVYAERQKQKEEEKRKEKLEDWERHQKGLGYRSKTKAPESSTGTSSNSKPAAPKPKKPLKPDYNPLCGDGGGAGFRPSRRGGRMGGG